ncbi:5-oxoprolinase subunit B family protein [Vibrio sp.]|uniref:5-oxoprolinase subunit B family protein n=1 Tax=Vibrio sp. TaxID=678 RepID=UPI003D12A099
MSIEFSLEPIAECSLMVVFHRSASAELSIKIGQVADKLHQQLEPWLINVTPAYTTILLDYLPHRISIFEFCPMVEQAVDSALKLPTDSSSESVITLPAYYNTEVGPDLEAYFARGLDLEQVIALHSETCYTVCAIGFAPGFAFLTEVDSQLQMPRQATPRLSVPRGSIAIAGNQTAVYPSQSPGGWNIIGNCPISLYNPLQQPVSPFKIGHMVRFNPIEREEFIELGGEVNHGGFA